MTALLLSTLGTAFPARADLVRGDTGTPEAMARHLRASDQSAVALANREVITDDKVELSSAAFTCSSGGSHGFIIEYNAPLGTPPTESRVIARIHQCRAFNFFEADSEQEGHLQSLDEGRVLERCDEIILRGQAAICGTYGQALANTEKMGQAIVYAGQNSNAVDRENFVTHGRFFVTASQDGEAALWYTTNDGATVLFSTYRDFNFTPAQLERFER